MPTTVAVNPGASGLTLCHKGSDGITTATIPDVCKTPSPGGPVPIPYPNIAVSADLMKGTTTVKADGGNMCANFGSEFFKSLGDEPGVAGGIASSTFIKEATWITFSFDVKLEGKGACRLTDKMFHNHQNTVNMSGERQAGLTTGNWDLDCILKALCKNDKNIVDDLSKRKIVVCDEVYWEDEVWDGKKWKKVKTPGLGGTDKSTKPITITVLSGMSCEEALDTLYHENMHANTKPSAMKWADEEYQVYTKTEEWLISRHPASSSTAPGKFSKKVGGQWVVDDAAIRDHVYPKPGVASGYPVVPEGTIIDKFPNGQVVIQDNKGKITRRKAKLNEQAPGPQKLKNPQTIDSKKIKCP
jgi:hypothetical protein